HNGLRTLRRAHSKGLEAGRPPGGPLHEDPAGHQPQDREGPRACNSRQASRPCRRSDRMNRRKFITLLAGAAAWPLSVNAQPSAKIPRIGLMVTGSLESLEARVQLDAFRQGLRQLGYTEGRNIAIEYRGADGRIERFPNLAAELVRLEVDLIFAANTRAALAARQATSTIPIVSAVMGDPVEDGLVASLAQPGGNVTGLTFLAPELTAKRMQLLKDALPNVSRVAALWHPGAYGERTMDDMLKATESAARTLGVQLQLIEVRAAGELE